MGLRAKQNSLAFKMGLGFGLIGLLLIGALSFTIYNIQQVDKLAVNVVSQRSIAAIKSMNIINALDSSVMYQHEWLHDRSPATKEKYQQLFFQEVVPEVQQLQANINRWGDKRNIALIENVDDNISKLQTLFNELNATDNVTEHTQSMKIITTNVSPVVNQIKLNLQRIVTSQEQQSIGSMQEILRSLNQIQISSWAFLVLGIVLCGILGVILTKSINRPIYQLVNLTRSLAKGKLEHDIEISGTAEFEQLSQALQEMVATLQSLADVTAQMAIGVYDHRVEVKSDDDVLAITVNQMLDSFNQIVLQANNIAKGDYSTDIALRSENDTLGKALQNMTQTLLVNEKHNEEENWFKDGINQLSSKIGGIHDLQELCSKGVSTICRYMEAGVGVVYIYDNKEQTLQLYGSYAYRNRDSLVNQVKLGEGVIGQVALEKTPILLRNVPREEANITSGTSEQVPYQVYAFPLMYENHLLGVMELASHTPFSELQIRYLDQAAPIFTIQINAAVQQTLTEKLLKDAKLMTHKLQTQQEELKATNEELEQQTQILKASEEELREKDEQQRAINLQLAERTKELERQKAEIEDKTNAVQKARDELKEKNDQLERASTYKSEFLANMSHELRTPLNSLLILAKLFADNEEGNLSDDQVESAQIMLNSGQDLLTLINDILDLAKVEAGKIELNVNAIKLQDFIDNIQRDFSHVAENKGIALYTELAENTPEHIITDDHRVGQILRNLIGNAMKFTEHGHIKLRITRPEADTDLSRSGLDPQHTIAFEVSDTGIGIPPEKQRLVFESFQQADGTTSREYGGTGLGLSISTQLSVLLGGEIGLHSTQGQGSTFILYLPDELKVAGKSSSTTAKSNGSQPNRTRQSSPSNQSKSLAKPLNKTIETIPDDRDSLTNQDNVLLIVEDDLKFAKILFNICHEKGFKCLHAADGQTGLQLAEKYTPNGILLDIGLPGMDGLTMLDNLKSQTSTQAIPVHIISATEEKEQALSKGAIGYLTKPVNRQQLESAIQQIESSSESNIRDLLIIEDNKAMQTAMVKLFRDKNVKITSVETGQQALDKLAEQHYDCIILDLGLPDMSGQELLEQFRKDNPDEHPAIIIHTGKDLSASESKMLNEYADSIIIKSGKASMERLIEETQLFLHRVAAELPQQNNAETVVDRMEKTLNKSSHQSSEGIKHKKILLVDDDMRNTFALSKTLKAKGFNVVMAANGKMALSTLNQEPDIALVLMDIMMPVMDGYEATEKIREQEKFKDIPIIALTAKVMKGDQEKCLQVGASDFIAKPIDIDKLIDKLKQWLA